MIQETEVRIGHVRVVVRWARVRPRSVAEPLLYTGMHGLDSGNENGKRGVPTLDGKSKMKIPLDFGNENLLPFYDDGLKAKIRRDPFQISPMKIRTCALSWDGNENGA